MKVLAVDPAASTGFCVAEISNDSANIFEYGIIDVPDMEYSGDKCIYLMEQIGQLITTHSIEQVAIEDYFFSKRFATGSDANMAYRTAIHIQCRFQGIPYHVINVSNWKKFVAGRSSPTKAQKAKWGKEPAKKLMIQEALWEKHGFRFPNHSISNKTGKPIKFRYDIVDAVGQMVFFCKLHLNVTNVELSVPVAPDVDIKNVKTQFIYPEE